MVVKLERRHESLRIERKVILRALIAHSQMDERPVIRRQAFEIERDANAVGGGRAKVIVELHRLASCRAAPREACSPSGGWRGELAEHRSAPATRAGCAKPALREHCEHGGHLEGRDARVRATQDQYVNVVRTFGGVD